MLKSFWMFQAGDAYKMLLHTAEPAKMGAVAPPLMKQVAPVMSGTSDTTLAHAGGLGGGGPGGGLGGGLGGGGLGGGGLGGGGLGGGDGGLGGGLPSAQVW